MKKKVLTMLLAVTMSATVGSPVCAADFTSGAENVTEFSESIVNGEDTPEDTADVDTVSEEADAVEKTEETVDAEESAAEPEKAGDAVDDTTVAEEMKDSEEIVAQDFADEEITDEEITDQEDIAPEFNDGQEDVLTDSAELSGASQKYHSMKKQSGYVYTATVKNVTDNDYVKFVPGKTGKYVIKQTGTSNGYTFTNGVYFAYNSKFEQISNVSQGGYSCYNLEKGKTYYLECDPGSKFVFRAELLADVVSIKPTGVDKSIAFYTPIDVSRTGEKNKYSISDRLRAKIKITYSDGKTETISTSEQNKYGQYVSEYIIYNGKKSSPEAGTYTIHLKFDGSKAEATIKNIKLKKLSSLPTINGSGSKTVSVSSNGMYVRFKTGKSTKYRVSASFPAYNLGGQGIVIEQEKKGSLEYVNYVISGKTCTLKANTVYYFYVNLHSGWKTNPTGTIKVTSVN